MNLNHPRIALRNCVLAGAALISLTAAALVPNHAGPDHAGAVQDQASVIAHASEASARTAP